MDLPMREPGTLTIGGATLNERTQAAKKQLRAQLRRVRLAWRIVLVATLLTLAGIVWLSQTSTVVSLGYQIDSIQKQEGVLNQQAQQLESQIATYENPAHVEQVAKAKLGMVYPDQQHIVYVKVPASYNQPDNTAQIKQDSNPNLVQVDKWWRQLTNSLPQPWQGSAPAPLAAPNPTGADATNNGN